MTATVSPPLTATGDSRRESHAAQRPADGGGSGRFATLLSRKLQTDGTDATATATFALAADAQDTPDTTDASDRSETDAAALAVQIHAMAGTPGATAQADAGAGIDAESPDSYTAARSGAAGRAVHGLGHAGFDGVDGSDGMDGVDPAAQGAARARRPSAHAADDMLAHIRASHVASGETSGSARTAAASLNAASARGARAGNVTQITSADHDADYLIQSADALDADARTIQALGQDGGRSAGKNDANLPEVFVTLAQTAPARSVPASGAPGTLSAAAAREISLPLNHPQWPQALGQRVLHFSQAEAHTAQVAELRLNPAELGPLRITIELHNHVAHASFVSAHAPVRHAVENALPQLFDQLAQAGISLGQTSVGEHGASGYESAAPQLPDMPPALAQNPAVQTAIPAAVRHPSALIDTFA